MRNMENKKSKILIVICVLVGAIALSLGGYFIYKQFITVNNQEERNIDQNDNNNIDQNDDNDIDQNDDNDIDQNDDNDIDQNDKDLSSGNSNAISKEEYLNNILTISENCNQKTINNFVKRINKIEIEVLKLLHDNNVEIRLFDGKITDEAEMKHFEGTYIWDGRLWDSVDGAYDHTSKVAFAACNEYSFSGTLFHEIGHAIDYALDNVSKEEEFNNYFKEERDQLFNPSDPYYNVNYEYFAQAFSQYYTTDYLRSELARIAPKTYNFLINLIENL